RRKRRGVCDKEQMSCCVLCRDLLKDPVSTSCGHQFCIQCISLYWDQSASAGPSSCPQFGKRSRSCSERGQTFLFICCFNPETLLCGTD
ncbi:hypothetical protein XENOCAPTIV_017315, partial [Xenoophorus captivus]